MDPLAEHPITKEDAVALVEGLLRRHDIVEFARAVRKLDDPYRRTSIRSRWTRLSFENATCMTTNCKDFSDHSLLRVTDDEKHKRCWKVHWGVRPIEEYKSWDGLDTPVSARVDKNTGEITDLHVDYTF